VPKIASITLAVLALIAARFWYRSTRVQDPAYPAFEPVETEGKVLALQGHAAHTDIAASNIASLNKRAAIWTTVAAILAALSSIVGNLS
jgi:hypothetical protein